MENQCLGALKPFLWPSLFTEAVYVVFTFNLSSVRVQDWSPPEPPTLLLLGQVAENDCEMNKSGLSHSSVNKILSFDNQTHIGTGWGYLIGTITPYD